MELPRHSEISRLVSRKSLLIDVVVTALPLADPESDAPLAKAGAGASTARHMSASTIHRRMLPSSHVLGRPAQRALDSVP